MVHLIPDFMRQHSTSVLLLFLAFLLCGCSSYRPKNMTHRAAISAAVASTRPERMITYQAMVVLEASEPDSVVQRVLRDARTMGGFFENRTNEIVNVSVPADQFEPFLEKVATYGKIKGETLSSEDVTDAYLDDQIRLENAERTRQRYLQLLDKAATVEETLLVEKELARLTEEIELYKGRLERMGKEVQYSYVTIYVQPPVKYGPLGYVGYGLWKAVQWIF